MIMRPEIKPAAMGAMMGLMMLWMLHGYLTGDSTMGALALLGFIGAHLIIIAAVSALGFWAAHRSPFWHSRLAHLHRPTAQHILVMLGGAALAVIVTHLILHGGL